MGKLGIQPPSFRTPISSNIRSPSLRTFAIFIQLEFVSKPHPPEQLIQVTLHIQALKPIISIQKFATNTSFRPPGSQSLSVSEIWSPIKMGWGYDDNPKMTGDCSTFRNSSNWKVHPNLQTATCCWRYRNLMKSIFLQEIRHPLGARPKVPSFCEVPHGMCWMKSSATCRQGNWDLQKPSGDITLLKGSKNQHLPKYHIDRWWFQRFLYFHP